MSDPVHIKRLAVILALAVMLAIPSVAEDATTIDPVEHDALLLEDGDIVIGEVDIAMEPDLTLDLPVGGDAAIPELFLEEVNEGALEDNSIPKALTLGIKETYALPVGKKTTFKSSKPAVASVSKKGVITARKRGTAKITIMSGKKKPGTCKVTVLKAPSKVVLKPKTLALEVGQRALLTAKLPSKTASNKLTWASSDESVATVDAYGNVTAIGAGTAKIVVRTFNKKKAACVVTVTAPEPVEEGWVLTQYPDASGNNAMCYSLVNRTDGILILVDGGWHENADTVRRIIDENGGRVKAWFLTHYHGDHIGAFNEVYDEYRDRIETIYVNPLDWQTFEPVAKYWDTPEEFSAFLEQTADANNVVKLHRGDTLKIDDISVRVFSSFDENVKQITGDWPNNSSLVFKLSLSEDSVLFMGDVWTSEMSQYLLDNFGAETLHADYIQTGHHGNGLVPNEFYGALNPGALFLDGPEWLMTGDSYRAKDLLAWCAENGIDTYDYRTAPNSFTLR